ncbi:hypothetical protein GCM10010421_02600 [Streptomyces glaucus]|uniref:UbiC transcription regulator-associated domain-containing protein n=1 Tax=Streptomyces glaucus TaxID=284029 RepID=A0ABN3J2K9_9ACTN
MSGRRTSSWPAAGRCNCRRAGSRTTSPPALSSSSLKEGRTPEPEPRQAAAEEASLPGIQKAALVTHIRRTYYSDDGRPVETADIVVPAARCEIVYEIPVNR